MEVKFPGMIRLDGGLEVIVCEIGLVFFDGPNGIRVRNRVNYAQGRRRAVSDPDFRQALAQAREHFAHTHEPPPARHPEQPRDVRLF